MIFTNFKLNFKGLSFFFSYSRKTCMLQDQMLEVKLFIKRFVLNSEDRVTNRTDTENLKYT